MITTELLVAIMGSAIAIVLALLGRRRQNGNGTTATTASLQASTEILHSENKQLRASADFLLAQNVALSHQTDVLREEVASLKHEVSRLRLELGDAQALLRNIGPRVAGA